jgi:hypothetical protein
MGIAVSLIAVSLIFSIFLINDFIVALIPSFGVVRLGNVEDSSEACLAVPFVERARDSFVPILQCQLSFRLGDG